MKNNTDFLFFSKGQGNRQNEEEENKTEWELSCKDGTKMQKKRTADK